MKKTIVKVGARKTKKKDRGESETKYFFFGMDKLVNGLDIIFTAYEERGKYKGSVIFNMNNKLIAHYDLKETEPVFGSMMDSIAKKIGGTYR